MQGQQQEVPADIADVPIQDLTIEGEPKQRYFLIGLPENHPVPDDGYKLLLVMPGGDGSAEFSPFVKRIYKNAIGEGWLVAQLVAPMWDNKQANLVVWPTSVLPYKNAKFTTEEFLASVIKDIQARTTINDRHEYLFTWSSGGPAAYAATLHTDSPFDGAFIAMSVSPLQKLDLKKAEGKRFYLLQSPDDQITKYRFAEAAEKALTNAKAKVKLESYEGGHGWRGPIYPMISEGVSWISSEEP